MWKPVGDDWVAQVQWRPEGTHSRRIDDFEAADVRLVAAALQTLTRAAGARTA